MGSMYQLIKTSDLYFRYETITTVDYETKAVIDLPGITICAETSHFLTPHHFHDLFGYEYNTTLLSTEKKN